jgi:RimJ/RimL family protein N-acetyltransferase
MGRVLDAPAVLPPPTIATSRLRLRPFVEGDADAVTALMSDAHVLRFWDAPPWREPGRAERFLAVCGEMAERGTGARVAVDRATDGAFLGWCGVSGYSSQHRSASLGFVYAAHAWGQGYATEAAAALVGWAFGTLDLHRVQAEADTRNVACRRVLEKLGFTLEGTLREDCVVDGVVSDSWVFGLLRHEWDGLPAWCRD